MIAGTAATESLVMSGSSVYAAYGVGVVKALANGESPASGFRSIDPRILAGTSAGGVNAAVLTSEFEQPFSRGVERLEQLWRQVVAHVPGGCGNGVYRIRGNPLRYTDWSCLSHEPLRRVAEFVDDAMFFARGGIQRGIDFFTSQEPIERRILQLADLSWFITTQVFQNNMPRFINLENIRQSDKLLTLVTTNWRTGEPRFFTNRDLTDDDGYRILHATTAVPVIFPPVHRIDGDIHIDGMLTVYAPLKSAIDAGAETIHIIFVDPAPSDLPLEELDSTIDSLDRIWTISFANQVWEDLDRARQINDGIAFLESFGVETIDSTLPEAALKSFVRIAGSIRERIRTENPYRKLTVHCHHPKGGLGGILGLLDFEQETISRLIDLGINDARHHDCQANGCVIP